MTDLNIEVKEFEFSQDFAWIITGCGLTFQVCINNGELDLEDTGFDWGLCGDANEECIEKYGSEACLNAIIAEIEQCEEINIVK